MKLSFYLTIFVFTSLSWARNPIPAGRYEALTGKKAANITPLQVNFGSEVEDRNPDQEITKHVVSLLKYLPQDSSLYLFGAKEQQRTSFYQQKGFKVLPSNEINDKKIDILILNFKEIAGQEVEANRLMKKAERTLLIFEDLKLTDALAKIRNFSSIHILKTESSEKGFRPSTVMLLQSE